MIHAPFAICLDQGLQLLGGRQRDEIARYEKLLIQAAGGVFNLGLILAAAQQQAHGRVVTFLEFVRLPVIQVEIHLAGVAVLERTHLEIDQQVTAKAAVIENEIDIVVLVADRDALLPGFEAEPGTKFEEKALQVIEQRAFEIGLAVMGFLRQSDAGDGISGPTGGTGNFPDSVITDDGICARRWGKAR